jgi:hypothetical protein
MLEKNDIKTKLHDAEIKIKTLTTELARATHQRAYLKMLTNVDSENQEVNPIPQSLGITYNKSDLFENIMFLYLIFGLPKPLLEIIIDYAYYNTYSFLCNFYQSVYFCDMSRFGIINNCSIEIEYGTCYVVDISTNELIDKYCFYECSCDCQYEYIHSKSYRLVTDQNKVYLLENGELILIIVIDNKNCTFIPINTIQEQQDYKICDIDNANKTNNEIVNKIINDPDFELEFFPKLQGRLLFRCTKNSYSIVGQKITIGFYTQIKNNISRGARPFILEYDLIQKQIINCYRMKDINETNTRFKFIFADDYVHILLQGYTYKIKIYTYKKVIE